MANISVLELSALDGTNGFQIIGKSVDDRLGISVSSAGDVNGDGLDDLLVGAWGADPGRSETGAGYVVFGRVSGFGATLNLWSLDGSNGFQMNGEAAEDWAGWSVSSAGDVNGDGFDDVIVGASGAYASGKDAGKSYVVFGKAGGFAPDMNLSSLNGTNGFQIRGEAAYDYSGTSVSSAGDVNGDGFDDILIGANGAMPSGIFSGAAYVVFGKADGFAAELNLSALDGTNGFQISGEAVFDRAGEAVSSAGDVNGDGFDDLLIGASGADPNSGDDGASYVVFGKASGFATNLALSGLDGTNGFQISGEAERDWSGGSVSSAGDVNGDGFGDLVIGAKGADLNGVYSGASYVVFGKAGGFAATLSLSGLDGANGFQINGEAEDDQSGRSVSSAGDVNGDGFDDLVIGAIGADPNGNGSGAAYVVFGKAGGFAANLELSGLNGTNGFQINGRAAGDSTGISVSGAGDVNDDGFDDLLIGAEQADPNGGGSGASYLVYGRATAGVSRLGTEAGERLFGGDFADTLDGGGGVDTLFGRSGNDTYVVTAAGEAVELADAGIDTVRATFNYTLEANLEKLQLLGAAVSGTGNALANTLAGTSGANTLNGGAGVDVLRGGLGNDTYIVDANGEAVESATAGTDTVRSSVSYSLGANLENLVLTGEAVGGTGNTLANILRGTSGANTLTGGLGQDQLHGGLGDDNYVVDAAGEALEAAGAGTDTVRSSVNYTLGANLENLVLTGAAVSGTGNGLANMIIGTSGANTLNGGAGQDVLRGGAGSDTYILDSSGDVAQEVNASNGLDSGGLDLVRSSVSHLLADFIENLTLTGSATMGLGNELADTVTGNTANNTLWGMGGSDILLGGAGADVLQGGLGNDTLTGGDGADRFVFNTAPGTSNTDRITDMNEAGDDTILLENAVFTALGSAGALAAAAFRANTTGLAGDSSDRIILETDTGEIYYDSNGSATGGTYLLLAQVDAGRALTTADFLVI